MNGFRDEVRRARRGNHLCVTLVILLIFHLLNGEGICKPASSLSQRYWITLQNPIINQTDLENELTQLRAKWSERSLIRREKNGYSVSELDLPLLSAEQREELIRNGATIVCQSRWLRAVSVEADKNQLNAIRALPFVVEVMPVKSLVKQRSHQKESVDPLPEEELSLGSYGFSFRQAELARAVEVHARGGTGRGVLIGVLDTGFQLDHRAFAGLDLVGQYDFINHDPDPSYDPRTDSKGQANHGTACLSVIGGYDPGRLVGIAPRASFALGKTEDTRSETAIEEDYWIEAIEWLEQLGADVVSSSLSYKDWYGFDEMDGRSPISRAAQRATELGMVICISAGNAGPGAITIGAPADADGVLAVAAVDSTGRLTNFSSRGPASDGRIKPDIAAMGRQVVCVKPMSFDEYTRWNGTSLACPIVAGVAALVIEAHPDWPGWKVVEALRMTASQSYMPDESYGYGLVDAVEAVDYPSLTVLSQSMELAGWGSFIEAKLKLPEGQSTTSPARLAMDKGFAKFVNMEPGQYQVSFGVNAPDSSETTKITVIGEVTLPPSGTLLLKDLNLP